ncbi:MAG: hypothetical protein WC249_02635 [Patescibacteria group bacterium]|jgi:hypothetical protein
MFPEQLKKILNIIKNTGDRVIIYDAANPDDSYALMDFSNYARLIDNTEKKMDKPNLINQENSLNKPELPVKSEKIENLTEEDLTDKINREISNWKNKEDSSYLGEENKPKKAWEISGTVKEKAQEIA